MDRRHFLLMTTALGGSLILPGEALACGEACEAAQSGGAGTPRLMFTTNDLVAIYLQNARDLMILILLLNSMHGLYPDMIRAVENFIGVLAMAWVLRASVLKSDRRRYPAPELENLARDLRLPPRHYVVKLEVVKKDLKKESNIVARTARKLEKKKNAALAAARRAGGKPKLPELKVAAQRKAAPALSAIERMRQKIRRISRKIAEARKREEKLTREWERLDRERRRTVNKAERLWRSMKRNDESFIEWFFEQKSTRLPFRITGQPANHRQEVARQLQQAKMEHRRIIRKMREIAREANKYYHEAERMEKELKNMRNKLQRMILDSFNKVRFQIEMRSRKLPAAERRAATIGLSINF